MQATITEAELIRASQAGDKDAFGSIVERYQSLICAITYSATGDFARSRELAKETFTRAFRSLPQLKDPSRFRLMLCRIARNLVDRSIRSERFDVIRDCEPKQAGESDTDEIPISKERQELVWRGLETIPERFREPMVFFHQRDSSQPAVAGDLDLPEPALIQYVSKARSLLRPEVASLIQDVLAKTAPGEAFTLAVFDALSKAPEPGKRPASNLQSQDASNLEYVYPSGPAPISKNAIYGAFAGGIFGGVAWLLPTSIMAKDWSAVAAVLAVAAAIFVISATLCIRNQAKRWRILGWVMIALCALNLAVINLRWDLWMLAYQEAPSYNAPTNLSRWTLNLIIAAIMAALLAIFLVLDFRQRKRTPEPRQSPSS